MPGKRNLNYISVGNRVHERRQALQLTQVELAERVGVSAAFIGQIERAEKIASIETMARLSRALDTSLDWLVLGLNVRCGRDECPMYGEIAYLLRSYGIGSEK